MLRSPSSLDLQTTIFQKRKSLRMQVQHRKPQTASIAFRYRNYVGTANYPSIVEIIDQYQARTGHTDYRLAKIAGISPSVISRIRSGRPPGWVVCNALATAMDRPHELLFRSAGLLPPAAEVPTLELDQLNRSFSKLAGWQKRLVLRLVNALLDDFHSG